MLSLMFAAALAAAPEAAAEAKVYPKPNISSPHWISRPQAAHLDAAYPPAAKAAGIGGRALLACDVNAEGWLVNCHARETPEGSGFAEAALKLVPQFRMAPRNEGGAAVGGAKVRVPITFSVN